MTRLILIRHGETDWNLEGRWQGQSDVPLNPKGHAQAQAIADQLAHLPISAIYASDLKRAQDTAAALSERKGLPIRIDSRFREIHQGEWQGLKMEEIETLYDREFQARREDPLKVAPPGGETTLQVQERVLAAIQSVVQVHPGETVAIFSHGFAIAVIRAYFSNHPPVRIRELVPHNGEIITIDLPDGLSPAKS